MVAATDDLTPVERLGGCASGLGAVGLTAVALLGGAGFQSFVAFWGFTLMALVGTHVVTKRHQSPSWWRVAGLVLVLAAVLLLTSSLALSQDAAQDLVTVVEPAERTTSRVILLVDCSGSMVGPPLERAVAAALKIARQGGDQLELACYAFAGGCVRWPAPRVEDETAPEGWISLPNETALGHLLGWLRTPVLSDTNVTEIGTALRQALAEPRDKLTVIVVSDGLLNDAGKALEILREGQAKRAERGLGAAVVACWTIGPEAVALNDLGRAGAGGCWREDSAPPDVPPRVMVLPGPH